MNTSTLQRSLNITYWFCLFFLKLLLRLSGLAFLTVGSLYLVTVIQLGIITSPLLVIIAFIGTFLTLGYSIGHALIDSTQTIQFINANIPGFIASVIRIIASPVIFSIDTFMWLKSVVSITSTLFKNNLLVNHLSFINYSQEKLEILDKALNRYSAEGTKLNQLLLNNVTTVIDKFDLFLYTVDIIEVYFNEESMKNIDYTTLFAAGYVSPIPLLLRLKENGCCDQSTVDNCIKFFQFTQNKCCSRFILMDLLTYLEQEKKCTKLYIHQLVHYLLTDPESYTDILINNTRDDYKRLCADMETQKKVEYCLLVRYIRGFYTAQNTKPKENGSGNNAKAHDGSDTGHSPSLFHRKEQRPPTRPAKSNRLYI